MSCFCAFKDDGCDEYDDEEENDDEEEVYEDEDGEEYEEYFECVDSDGDEILASGEGKFVAPFNSTLGSNLVFVNGTAINGTIVNGTFIPHVAALYHGSNASSVSVANATRSSGIVNAVATAGSNLTVSSSTVSASASGSSSTASTLR